MQRHCCVYTSLFFKWWQLILTYMPLVLNLKSCVWYLGIGRVFESYTNTDDDPNWVLMEGWYSTYRMIFFRVTSVFILGWLFLGSTLCLHRIIFFIIDYFLFFKKNFPQIEVAEVNFFPQTEVTLKKEKYSTCTERWHCSSRTAGSKPPRMPEPLTVVMGVPRCLCWVLLTLSV